MVSLSCSPSLNWFCYGIKIGGVGNMVTLQSKKNCYSIQFDFVMTINVNEWLSEMLFKIYDWPLDFITWKSAVHNNKNCLIPAQIE